THTGMLATLDVDGKMKVTYGLVRGWDVFDDSNGAWTHIVGVSAPGPFGDDTVAVNTVVGTERPLDSSDLRAVADLVWTREWSKTLSTTLNVDAGREQGAAPDGRDASWWGVAGYVTKHFTDRLAGTVRAEVFRDVEGAR